MNFSHYDFKYIDSHSHFFPPRMFQSVWRYFEAPDGDGKPRNWPVFYKLDTDALVQCLASFNVKRFTTYNYAHKKGIARFMNDWTYQFASEYKQAIPFGSVWPEDEDRVEYISKALDEYGFYGIKIQPLVQNFYPADPRMTPIYDLILEKNKWICMHAGTAPYRNQYVGYKHFVEFLKKYPDIKVIIAHMGAFEYKKFLALLDTHENMYLDTTMIYVPNNIFPERKSKRPKAEDLLSYQDRILFGTDFPNIPYKYENSTRGLLEMNLPRDFYEKIFYKNAESVFNLPR
ncbi:MAG: amidohydrolase [Candidatus Lokiarchaeota archaeon]|nr:amidohydrolase [Candidatus Lokiarchaeota archaeon]